MDLDRVRELLAARSQPAYRLEQISRAVYREGAASYEEITALPKALREELSREAPILSVAAARITVARDRRAHKALLRLRDGKVVESVLLKPKPGPAWSACISCQVGCAMGCTFCATGLMGLTRSLTPEEIADQALFWRGYLRSAGLPGALTNVVYMGMGEPFHCYDALAASLRILLDPARLGFSPRKVAVSTVGLVPGIERFAAEFPQVNLALSLHAAEDPLRRTLVPVNRAFPLPRLRAALAGALARTRRKIFLEYVLLEGENDQPRHARALAEFIRSIGRPDLLHVNLIAWNPTDTPHRRPEIGQARVFRDLLRGLGLSVTVRRNLGTEISGACGQLWAEEKPPQS